MTQTHEIDGKNFITARAAGKLVGYTGDYITRLAREGKIDARQVGRQWFVEPESLKLFSLEQEAEKRDRGEQLREDRRRERTETLRKAHEAVLISSIETTQRSALVQTAIVSFSLFLLVNVFWFSYEARLDTERLFGGIIHVGSQLSDAFIKPIPDLISQMAAFAFVEDRERGRFEAEGGVPYDSLESSDPAFQGVVLFDDENVTDARLNEVRRSFSDEVQVEFDNDDSGVVTPVFRERDGASYRFLLVPIRSPAD